jgi:DNA-binding SARP family transcriptional activator
LGKGIFARLELLNSFAISGDDAVVRMPLPAQRLLAFLAVRNGPVPRDELARALWPGALEPRRRGSLRSALWRLPRRGPELVEAADGRLRLSPAVSVDLHEAMAAADRACDRSVSLAEAGAATALLRGELLPDWYDDWVLVERERFRERRVGALVVLCRRLAGAGRFADAVDAGLAAMRAEPLREAAHRALVEVYLAEGNRAQAVRQYRLCRRFLRERLGLEPSPRMRAALAAAVS